jgi:hypothetical protein
VCVCLCGGDILNGSWLVQVAAESQQCVQCPPHATPQQQTKPNPPTHPAHTQALSALNGDWKLVYTSNSELLAILALSKLPFVTIGDITQRVDAATSSVENRAQISVPLSRTEISTTASFEVRSPKRLAIKFERGAVSTPQLLSDIEIPETVSVLGQTVDLTAVRGLLQPVGDSLAGVIKAVGGFLSQQPDLSFPIPAAGGGRSETWLLTTYLDEDTRITRWVGGVCVLAGCGWGGWGGGAEGLMCLNLDARIPPPRPSTPHMRSSFPIPRKRTNATRGDGGSVFILVKEVVVATPSEIIEPPSSSAISSPPAGETPAGYI